jgi:hypothetical protein
MLALIHGQQLLVTMFETEYGRNKYCSMCKDDHPTIGSITINVILTVNPKIMDDCMGGT